VQNFVSGFSHIHARYELGMVGHRELDKFGLQIHFEVFLKLKNEVFIWKVDLKII
jgi:hypothetical protein